MEMICLNVGVTGSIACGKSAVSNYLKKLGYIVIDADKIGHEMLNSKDVVEKLVKIFGEQILDTYGVNRLKLGSLVFGNSKNLEKLNEIIHPKIKNEIRKIEKKYFKEKLVFVDVALLFEAKFSDLVDKTIVVYCDEKTQLERLMKRNNLTKQNALRRISSQLSSKEKAKLGDYVVNNSNSLEFTYKQVDNIIEELLKGDG